MSFQGGIIGRDSDEVYGDKEDEDEGESKEEVEEDEEGEEIAGH